MTDTRRWLSLISSVWAGMLLTVGGLAAPALFQVLDRVQAGTGAGRIFTLEARVSLLLGLAMLVLSWLSSRSPVGRANLVCLLLVIGLTAVGHFGLHPLIQAVKTGQPLPEPFMQLTFAQLHGASSALFALKTVLVVVLSWRLSARG